jgi:hypothetical protein
MHFGGMSPKLSILIVSLEPLIVESVARPPSVAGATLPDADVWFVAPPTATSLFVLPQAARTTTALIKMILLMTTLPVVSIEDIDTVDPDT